MPMSFRSSGWRPVDTACTRTNADFFLDWVNRRILWFGAIGRLGWRRAGRNWDVGGKEVCVLRGNVNPGGRASTSTSSGKGNIGAVMWSN